MYDALEIFRTLGAHQKESFIKLGFYLVSIFYYLSRYVFGRDGPETGSTLIGFRVF